MSNAIPEIYVSTDVEADGPIPGPHSMLSFASAAYTADKELIGTFSANLETLDGASPHPIQAAWWKTQPEAWAACRTELTLHPDELQTLRGQLRRQPVINGVFTDLVSLHGSVRVSRVVHHGTVIELGM